ncbi:MAG: hypothetical protein ABI378_03280 [Chitinophagaceae bacterium]
MWQKHITINGTAKGIGSCFGVGRQGIIGIAGVFHFFARGKKEGEGGEIKEGFHGFANLSFLRKISGSGVSDG